MKAYKLIPFLLLFSLTVLAQSPQTLTWTGVRGSVLEKTIPLDSTWTGTASVKAYTEPGGRLISTLLQPTFTREGNTLFVRFPNPAGLSNSTYVTISTGTTLRYAGYVSLGYTIPPIVTGGGSLTPISTIISYSMVQGLSGLLANKFNVSDTNTLLRKASYNIDKSSTNTALSQRVYHVADIATLQLTPGTNLASVVVRDKLRGGTFVYDASLATYDYGVTFPALGGGGFRRLYTGPIFPEWFGAKPYRSGYFIQKSGNITTGYFENSGLTIPVVNSGDAIRRANDAAEASSKWVQMGSGIYFADSIFVNDGNRFEGVSIGDFGSRSLKDGTSIMQLPGVNRDFMTFRTTYSLGSNRVTGIILQNFILRGNNGNTIGNGISFRNFGTNRAVDSTHANLNGSHTIENIFLRDFAENGMYMRNGGVPAQIRHINIQTCGGYGILWEGKQVNRNVTLENIDGDGNAGGALLKLATTSTSSSFTVRGIRSETKDNAVYGVTSGFDRAQPYVIEIGDMTATSSVHISDVYANAYNTPNKAADAAIFVNTTTDANMPFIQWENVVTLPMSGGGAASILYDNRNGVRLDTLRSGIYSRRGYTFGIAGTNNRLVVGGNGKQTRLTIADNTITARGNYPGIGIYENDFQGGMAFTQNGGSLAWRMTDSLGNNNGFLSVSRSALINPLASFVEWTINGNGAFRVTGGNSANIDFKDNDAGTDNKTLRLKSNNQGIDFTRLTDANALIDTTLRLFNTGDLQTGRNLITNAVLPVSPITKDIGATTNGWRNVYAQGLYSPSGSTLTMATLGSNSIGMQINGTKFFHIQPTTGAVLLQSGGTFTANSRDRLQVDGSIKFKYASGTAAPTTSDLATGECILWKETTGGTLKYYCNDGGTIKAGAAFN